AERVAELVVALIVERRARQLRIRPVAGRDVRSTQTAFHLIANRRHLQLDAGSRHADPSAGERGVAGADRERRALSGAKSGDERDAVAWARRGREPGQIVGNVLAEGGRRAEAHLETAEEVRRE